MHKITRTPLSCGWWRVWRWFTLAPYTHIHTEILCLSESVDFLSFLDMYLPVFLVLFVCVCACHGVHRQTNRHSREISELVPARTRALTHADIARTPLSCGSDERHADSLSLLIHTYINRHTSMHVCLFDFLSIPDSWLPDSDFLSLLIQSYIPICSVCSLTYLFFFPIFFLSILFQLVA